MQFRAKIATRLTQFAQSEDGAVTVDWIVLTAALVLLGLGAAVYVNSAVPELADRTADFMSDMDVGAAPF